MELLMIAKLRRDGNVLEIAFGERWFGRSFQVCVS
jgi:hypothetical protein